MDAAALSSLANRLYAAEVQAAPQVEESIRVALYRTDAISSPAWGLALVVACWMRQNAGDSLDDIASTGVSPLIDQIKSFEGWFPPAFQKFRDTAQAGGDRGSIAAAGSYFTSALKDLGSIAKQGFLAWLASPKFTTVARALVKRLGGPANPSAPARPSPAQAFDHADYRVARRTPPASAPSPQPAARLVEAAPQKSDLLLASLLAVGWSPQDAARILAGPGAGKSAASGQDRPAPAPNGARPDKTVPVQSKQGDAGAIPGVIKSGIDLARDIFKTVTASPPSGKTNGQKGSKGPATSNPADKRMSEESAGDFGSADDDMPGEGGGEDDRTSAEPGTDTDTEVEGGMDDDGRITDPSSYVNDSSEVVD